MEDRRLWLGQTVVMGRFNDVRRFAEIDSTNRWVAEQARGGAAEGLVAVAEMQSAGRGRLDRTWIAPAGSALLCTILVRPRMPMARWHWLNLAMAVAAQDACRLLSPQTRGIGRFTNTQSHEFEANADLGLGFAVAVKWPNDLIVPSMDDRKLAGILSEMVLTAKGEGAVAVGIGLNVLRPYDVDPEVAARGVWLNELLGAPTNTVVIDPLLNASTHTDSVPSSNVAAAGDVNRGMANGSTIDGTMVAATANLDRLSSPSVDDVLTVLLLEFERQVVEVEDRPDAFLETYRQRCITVGRQVRAMLPSSDIVGIASGIDSDGQLLVTTADGVTHTISAADVVHIRPTAENLLGQQS